MMFVLEVLFYTVISRLIGKLFFKQNFKDEQELRMFAVTYVLMTLWLLFLDWIL